MAKFIPAPSLTSKFGFPLVCLFGASEKLRWNNSHIILPPSSKTSGSLPSQVIEFAEFCITACLPTLPPDRQEQLVGGDVQLGCWTAVASEVPGTIHFDNDDKKPAGNKALPVDTGEQIFIRAVHTATDVTCGTLFGNPSQWGRPATSALATRQLPNSDVAMYDMTDAHAIPPVAGGSNDIRGVMRLVLKPYSEDRTHKARS